jgi:dTDP-4-dehydrorhamnose 3,5-epimerase
MKVTVERSRIPDVLLVRHQVFQDDRGFFMEVFRQDVFAEAGLPAAFVQLNHSRSARGVLRGLHFQWDPPMGKLMRVTEGTAFLVAVDIRKGSPTLGRWVGVEVSARDRLQVWAPAGFARGFCVLSEHAEIQYLCTGVYNPDGESGILWSDPALGIDWPVEQPTLSAKDGEAQTLARWLERPESDHFVYGEPGAVPPGGAP